MTNGDDEDAVDAGSDASCHARLVLWGGGAGLPGRASLYPVDANAFSEPLFTFALQADQELPRLDPGAVVTIHGELERGSHPLIDAAGTAIRAASGLVPGAGQVGSRLFAERGNVLGHPAVVGWRRDWRYTRSGSLDPVSAWQRRLRTAIWSGWLSIVWVVVMIGLLVFVGLRGRAFAPVGGGGAGLVSSLASFQLARRSRRALEGAERSLTRPSEPMLMRLRWTAGHGQGPMAVATLFASEDANGERPISHVSVINVPSSYAPEGIVRCEVVGDPDHAPIIRVPEGDLWPVEEAHHALGHERPRFFKRKV